MTIDRSYHKTLIVLIFLIFQTACNKAGQSEIDDLNDLGPIEEFASYRTVVENFTPGKRTQFVETPKLVLVVRPGLTKPELERIAKVFMRANPGTEIDFFDSKERLDNYVNSDSFDPRSSYKTDMTYDADFKAKHLKATVQKVENSFIVSTDGYDPYQFAPYRSPTPR